MVHLQHLKSRAHAVKIAAFDVDGILTNGTIVFGSDGTELKEFHTLDGLGIELLQEIGVEVFFITVRASEVLAKRAQELGVQAIQGRRDKLQVMCEILEERGMTLEQVAYMGDDLLDLALIHAAGLGMTVPNGHDAVKEYADGITEKQGGQGAVREVCDLILWAQDKQDAILQRFLYP